jgi:inward rectifier potassium channel
MNRNVFNRFRSNVKEFTDSGLSNQVGYQSSRLLNPNGTFNVNRTGRHRWHDISPAHELITMKWRKFYPIVFGFYILVNLLFATTYYLIGMDQFMGPVVETKWDEFQEAFFFSAQTITTVGYGRLNPVGFWPNLISSFESLMGLLIFAIVTGLMYGRFARPIARLLFSQNALITPFQNGKALMFRLANSKSNDLTDVEAQVLLSLVIYDGQNYVRKYYNLELERKVVNALALSWTVVHPINENSPMFDFTPENMAEYEAEILVTIKGFDTTFSQVVIGRTSYHFSSLVWNAKFRPVFKRSEDGRETVLELDHLNDFDKLDPTPAPTLPA